MEQARANAICANVQLVELGLIAAFQHDLHARLN